MGFLALLTAAVPDFLALPIGVSKSREGEAVFAYAVAEAGVDKWWSG